MPRPIQSQIYPDFGWQAILKRPACAVLMGALTAEWSAAEALLTWYYGVTLYGPIVHDVEGWEIAVRTFERVRDFHVKKKTLLEALANRKLNAYPVLSAQIVEAFGERLSQIARNKDLRNVLAHGHWGILDEYPDSIIWRRTYDSLALFEYTHEELRSGLVRLTDASKESLRFFRTEIVPALTKHFEEDWANVLALHDTLMKRDAGQRALGDS
jgi:hypothetical protein